MYSFWASQMQRYDYIIILLLLLFGAVEESKYFKMKKFLESKNAQLNSLLSILVKYTYTNDKSNNTAEWIKYIILKSLLFKFIEYKQ